MLYGWLRVGRRVHSCVGNVCWVHYRIRRCFVITGRCSITGKYTAILIVKATNSFGNIQLTFWQDDVTRFTLFRNNAARHVTNIQLYNLHRR